MRISLPSYSTPLSLLNLRFNCTGTSILTSIATVTRSPPKSNVTGRPLNYIYTAKRFKSGAAQYKSERVVKKSQRHIGNKVREMSSLSEKEGRQGMIEGEEMGNAVFAQGHEVGEGEKEVGLLVGGEGRWKLISSGKGIERSFAFKGFGKAWEFMNAIAAECKIQKHHPEWSNVYNTVFIRWTTHSPPGLSSKDVKMAHFCDAQAAIFNEVIPGPSQEPSATGRELADTVAAEGGDCCVPASARKSAV